MDQEKADKVGREASALFVDAYVGLMNAGYVNNARAMMLTCFPSAIANTPPMRRAYAMADLIEIYALLKKEVFEDSRDLYDYLTKGQEKSE
jgi:hypothetical protein